MLVLLAKALLQHRLLRGDDGLGVEEESQDKHGRRRERAAGQGKACSAPRESEESPMHAWSVPALPPKQRVGKRRLTYEEEEVAEALGVAQEGECPSRHEGPRRLRLPQEAQRARAQGGAQGEAHAIQTHDSSRGPGPLHDGGIVRGGIPQDEAEPKDA